MRAVGARCALGVALSACLLPHAGHADEEQVTPVEPATVPSGQSPSASPAPLPPSPLSMPGGAPLLAGPAPAAVPAVAFATPSSAVEGKGPYAVALMAPLAGALTAFLPLVVGSLLLAQNDHPGLQRAGVTTILAGFAVGPWVGHAGSSKWGRAAAFGAASLAASAATWIVMEARDPFDPRLGNHKRVPFGVLFTAAFSFGAVGVADGFLVGPSRREP